MRDISSLSEKMIQNIEAKRSWVRNHYAPETISEYDTFDGKLRLLDVIIKSGWVEKTETLKLQCLGITLGDVFVQDIGFEWIEVDDEFGKDPALQMPNTSVILFPQTMISKRMEHGEQVAIYELYDYIKQGVLNILADL